MPVARPRLTRPLPRPVRRGPRRAVRQSGGPGAPLGLVLGGWNYLARVWIAFDPPTAPLPTWIEITGFVETGTSITIQHGRQDGIGDVSASTCSLTVDNSDGRFCAENPTGAWFGLLDLGCWLKVDVLAPSGNVSDRFVGFTNNLPTGWTGQYASSQITAADRYEKIGQAPNIISMIQSEVLTDLNLTGNVKGYWNLHEQQGSLSFGDTSGNNARHLQAVAYGGVPVGYGFGAANANSPGVEGLRCVTFNPPSSTQGTYLTTAITTPVGTWNYTTGGYTGLYPTVEFWFQATTTGVTQPLVSLVDPVNLSAVTIYIDGSTGLLYYNITPTIFGATSAAEGGIFSLTPIADGKWHHVVFAVAFTSNGGNFYSRNARFLDGGQGYFSVLASGGAPFGGLPNTYGSAFTQLTVGGGWLIPGSVVFNVGAANISDLAYYWSAVQPVGGAGSSGPIPNVTDHFAAGTTGIAGETTDARLARISRYAGIPIPTQTISAPVWYNGINTHYTTQVYNPGKGPWTNLSAGAHACGPQSMAGRGSLDVLREAARTEFMPVFVDKSGYLSIQPSTIRQNTSPAWTVDARDLDPATGDAKDYAYTTNQATITPNGQAAQTVIGPYGAASQARYGVYSQGGSLATANQSPIEAQSLGYAVVQQRSKPLSRLAPLVVEVATLATQAGYGTAWYDAVLASEISTPIRVTNTPPQMGGGYSDVFLEGWTETLSPGNHTFAYSTSPVQGPTVQLDDAVLGRLDTDGSTLSAACGPNDTTLTFVTTNASSGSPLWTMTPTDLPVDVNIGGEQVTLTGFPSIIGPADGTFETGVTGWTESGGGTIAASSADHYQGSACGLMSLGASTFGFLFPGSVVPAAAGTVFWVSVAVKLLSGTASALLYVTWETSSFTSAGSTTIGTVSAGSGWTVISGYATAPATAAYAYPTLQVTGTTGAQIYVDYVVFQPATAPQLFTVTRQVNGTGSGQLLNYGADGTFESGVGAWTPNGGTVAAAGNQFHTGTQSALLTTTGSPSQTYLRPPNTPVTASTTYTAGMWVLTASGSPQIICAIDTFDINGGYLSTYASATVTGPSGWTYLSVTVQLDHNAAYAAIGPSVLGTPPNGTAIYVDDIAFALTAGHAAGTPVSVWTPLTLAY